MTGEIVDREDAGTRKKIHEEDSMQTNTSWDKGKDEGMESLVDRGRAG